MGIVQRIRKLLLPQPSPLKRQIDLIRRVQKTSPRRAPFMEGGLDLGAGCYLIPADREDGLGIQSMVRIGVMLLADQLKATYVHVPFLKLAHQHRDDGGRSVTAREWANRWESFLNMGAGEIHLSHLARAVGKVPLARQLADRRRRVDGPRSEPPDRLPSLIKRLREGGLAGAFVFDLAVCRQPSERNFMLTTALIDRLRAKLESNGYVTPRALFRDDEVSVAVHIRRGDVWQAISDGSNRESHDIRFVPDDYFTSLITRLHRLLAPSVRNVTFHIFSDGAQSDFPGFTFGEAGRAVLQGSNPGEGIPIQFHLNHDAIDSLYHMTRASILVPGKSSFSVLASMLSRNVVVRSNETAEFYQYDMLAAHMGSDARYVSASRLETGPILGLISALHSPPGATT